MFSILSNFFQKNCIELYAPLGLEHCTLQKPYLLERAGIKKGTAILFAVPYFTHAALDPQRNLSAYAIPRDYHGYMQALFDVLLPQLRSAFPQARFVGFADHSPILEVEAAAKAGLGVIGKNRLLITERYSSYIFLGALFTDLSIPYVLHPIRTCLNCGACAQHCPSADGGTCLSALTQKKGELTYDETNRLLQHSLVWGCDTCQEVCPYTKIALHSGSIFSPIPYFFEQSIPHLTPEEVNRMTDAEFAERAYAWRGKQTISRNLLLQKEADACKDKASRSLRKGSTC